MRAGAAVAIAAWIVLASSMADARSPDLAPMPWRNVSPLSIPHGLPQAIDARLPARGEHAVWLGTTQASQFVREAEGDDAILLDGETTLISLGVRSGLGAGWALEVQLPWVRQGDGFLDGPIDAFHDVTGLPDGGRDERPSNALRYRWIDGGVSRLRVDAERSGLGDARVALDRALLDDGARAVTMRLLVEAPTGDGAAMAGGDGFDGALAVHLSDRALFAWPLALHAGAAAVRLGDDGVSGDRRRRWAGWGSLGLAWPLGAGVALKGQVDMHTRLIDTGVDRAGDWSVQGSLGAAWTFAPGWSAEIAFQEDLRSEASSDIAFAGVLRRRLRR